MMAWLTYNEEIVNHMLVVALLGYSMYIVMRIGHFSVAGAAFWAIGCYATAFFTRDGAPAAVVATGLTLFSLALGFLLALLLARLKSLSLTMVTVALVLLIRVLVINWEPVTGGALGIFGLPMEIGMVGLSVILAVTATAAALYERGKSGRTQEAIRLDESLAQSVGIDVRRQRILALTLSAGLGGLGGSLNVLQLGLVTPEQAGFGIVVDALTVVIIGGTAAWYGPLIGALVVAWLPELLRFAEAWRTIVQGIIVIALVVYAPGGAVGLVRSLRRSRLGQRLSAVRRAKRDDRAAA